MNDFNYEESRKRIEDILNSKTDIKEVDSISNDEDGFTYENGVRTWVGAMFIDIRNSTDYFKENNPEKVARVMRAFTSEIIEILRQNKKHVQIGIRGDCVYAIYSTPTKNDINDIFSDACFINTFQNMFQEILINKDWPTFEIGIGLGASKDLVIKAGRKGSGINDNIWIGNAVVDASKLSSEGNTISTDSNGKPTKIETIVMNSCFYTNIKNFVNSKNQKFATVHSKRLNTIVYSFDFKR